MTTTPDPLTGAPLPTTPPTPAQAMAEQAALDVPIGPLHAWAANDDPDVHAYSGRDHCRFCRVHRSKPEAQQPCPGLVVAVRDHATEAASWGHGAGGPVVRNVTIGHRCPTCGGPRGVPRSRREFDDGDYYTVSVWDNPCGHVDTYAAVLAEASR